MAHLICCSCSGIHRGMGTHISRVKSVDLDAWTDEQLNSILRWGNIRANKLVSITNTHHVVVPSKSCIGIGKRSLQSGMCHQKRKKSNFVECCRVCNARRKIENFIRTKYESKRWVMDGPMPDPATLDAEGDDNVVLSMSPAS